MKSIHLMITPLFLIYLEYEMYRKNYYRDFVLHLKTEILSSSSKSQIEEEQLTRVLLSRAYYTAFLYCREQLKKQNPNLKLNNQGANEHDYLMKIIGFNSKNKEVKRLLRELKDERIVADYEVNISVKNNNTFQDPRTNKEMKIDVDQTVQNMEDILNAVIYSITI